MRLSTLLALVVIATLVACWFLAPYVGEPRYFIVPNPNYK
jgi:hypothetical protein